VGPGSGGGGITASEVAAANLGAYDASNSGFGSGGVDAGGGGGGDGGYGAGTVGYDAGDMAHDSGGGDGGGGGGGCFITTATVRHLGEADDGPTLTALRAFRDRYMAATPARREQVKLYYARAPRIVGLLDSRADAAEIYRSMWERFIEPAARAARAGDDERAYALYIDGMKWAEERAS